jgi:hypothetical protein
VPPLPCSSLKGRLSAATVQQPQDIEALNFLDGGCRDTAFLRDNGISLVYTPFPVNNTDLVEVRPYVYLLQEVQSP